MIFGNDVKEFFLIRIDISIFHKPLRSYGDKLNIYSVYLAEFLCKESFFEHIEFLHVNSSGLEGAS